jgi:hypothetical protein
MHPEVQQVGPGSCRICGMALEPVVVAAEAPPNPELVDMTRRFWIALVLTLPVAALQMGGHFAGFNAWVGQGLSNLVQLVMGEDFPAMQDWIKPNLSNLVQMEIPIRARRLFRRELARRQEASRCGGPAHASMIAGTEASSI